MITYPYTPPPQNTLMCKKKKNQKKAMYQEKQIKVNNILKLWRLLKKFIEESKHWNGDG